MGMNWKTVRARAHYWWQTEIRPLLIIALVVFAVRSSLADWNDVPTGSMKPTILEGDRVFVNKLAYDLKVPFTTFHLAEWGNPQRGDVVVFYSPHDGTRLVKRVIGLPGDTVEIRAGQVLVNGIVLREPYASGPTAGNVAPVHVPEDTVFVMGDNRAPGGSLDSRRLGPIPLTKLMGRARLAIWPITSFGLLNSIPSPAQ